MKWIRILKRLILKNMPVILALLSVWYNNFFGAESEALIPYTIFAEHRIYSREPWRVMAKVGRWETSTVPNRDYYLGEGTNAQHAFFSVDSSRHKINSS
jgi:glucose-6-phosphate isomerase